MYSQLLNCIMQNKGILNFAFTHFSAKNLESVDFQWSHLFFQSEEIYRKGQQLKWHSALKGWEGTFAILIIYITVITKLQKSCPHPPIKKWIIWANFHNLLSFYKKSNGMCSLSNYSANSVSGCCSSESWPQILCTHRKRQLESVGFDEQVLKNTFNKLEGQGTTGQCVWKGGGCFAIVNSIWSRLDRRECLNLSSVPHVE